jgi:hypothetical protein
MSKKFGFSEVDLVKGRIEPSIEEVQITGVLWDTNPNGKDFLAVNFVTLDNNREHEERFFFSTEKGEKISLQRIKSLIKVIAGEEASKKEYDVDQLNALLTGKKIRAKFTGSEYTKTDDNGDEDLRVGTSLAFAGFAESLEILKEDSKLSFNSIKFSDTSSKSFSNNQQTLNPLLAQSKLLLLVVLFCCLENCISITIPNPYIELNFLNGIIISAILDFLSRTLTSIPTLL